MVPCAKDEESLLSSAGGCEAGQVVYVDWIAANAALARMRWDCDNVGVLEENC